MIFSSGMFFLSLQVHCVVQQGNRPKMLRKLPDFRAEKKRRILSRLWLSWFFDPDKQCFSVGGDRYDWTTGPGYRTMDMTGGSSGSYVACTPCVQLCYTGLICLEAEEPGSRRAFRFPGEGGDHFHCCIFFAWSYSVSIFGDPQI